MIAITIFTIFTGITSVLSYIYICFFSNTPKLYKQISGAFFFLASIWSAYILIIPESSILNNVSNKLTYYQAPTTEMVNDRLLIQRGGFSLSGFEPIAIEFQHPYLETPKVEIININGHSSDYIPRVIKTTPHQVVFKSNTAGGFSLSRSYNWIARGKPLKVENP